MAQSNNDSFSSISVMTKQVRDLMGTDAQIPGTISANLLNRTTIADDQNMTVSLTGATDSSLIISSTGTGVDALQLTASAGGIDISATGNAGDDIDITATGTSVNISSDESIASAITIAATGAAGGIQLTSGTGGVVIDSLLVPNAEQAAITADPTPTQAQSGTIFRCDTSGAAFSVTLPTAVVGMSYTFVLSDASNDLTINCAAVTDSMLGAVTIADDEGTGNSNSAAANGGTHDRCLIDVSAGVVVAGSFVKFTALSTTVWFVEGIVISGDGAQAAVVFSSN